MFGCALDEWREGHRAGRIGDNRGVTCFAVVLFGVLLQASARAATSPTPPAERGPAVGQPLPAFEARDQDGKPRTFESLRGEKGLVLLFYRSADW